MSMTTDLGTARIMLVDDEMTTRHLLAALLEQAGYRSQAYEDGAQAWEAALKRPPDLVLLDIRLPGEDGYTLCRRFASHPKLCRLPVIFISGLQDSQAIVKGFEVGGRDYIIKPFNATEVLARVATQLRLRHYEKELERQRVHLEAIVAERTRDLQHAYTRLHIWDETKDQMLQQLSHELHTPLNGIFPLTDILLEECRHNTACSTANVVRDLYSVFQHSRTRMLNVIEDILQLSKLYMGKQLPKPQALPLDTLLISWTREVGLTANVNVPCSPAGIDLQVIVDPVLLRKSLGYLLTAAHHNTRAKITWSIFRSACGQFVQAHLTVPQWHLPQPQRTQFFDIFQQNPCETGGNLSGFSMGVVYRIIRLMDGNIELLPASDGSQGSCFLLGLPAAEKTLTVTTTH
jgi:two-component system sensor histidine kinase/response regulator